MAAEYTPNTGIVRSVWIASMVERHGADEAYYGAEFDRWLAEHDAEVSAERAPKEWPWPEAGDARPDASDLEEVC